MALKPNTSLIFKIKQATGKANGQATQA